MEHISQITKKLPVVDLLAKRELGRRVDSKDLVGLFESQEGSICQYYGRIGQGKTYNATADIFDDLRKGEVVYCNWQIDYEGFDERKSPVRLFFGIFSKRFYVFPKENLRYFKLSNEWARTQRKPDKNEFYEDFMDWFSSRTDCKMYIDEGHVLFNSYEGVKMSMEKVTALLHTRHFNRTINIITQRPTAVHVSARGNVNVFYKCEKRLSWPFLIFRRSEYQDMVNETVDEDSEPISKKTYFARKQILEAYNSQYLRGGIPRSQEVFFEAFDLSLKDRLKGLWKAFLSRSSGFALRSDKRL